MNLSLAQRFPGVRAPHEQFENVQNRLRTLPLYVDISMAAARSLASGMTEDPADTSGKALVLNLCGNVLYVDQKANTGNATLHFNDTVSAGNTPLTVFPGFLAKVPFVRLIVENSAQTGSTMRFIYGVDIDFLPAVSAGVFGSVTIAGTVNTREQGYPYGASYVSASLIAAGATSQVFAAASNVNGATVHSATCWTNSAAIPQVQLIAKAIAPVSGIEGDILNSAIGSGAGVAASFALLTGPIQIPAGKGLFFFSAQLETGAHRSVLFTLL
jgi:hypothetical protein